MKENFLSINLSQKTFHRITDNQKKHHSILEKLHYNFLFPFLPSQHLNITYKDYMAVYFLF